MSTTRILGAAILVAGLVLLGFAWNASDAPVEQVSETLTGSYTDETMWYWVVGALAAAGGTLLAVFGRGR